ncbi:MAG: hypothetical protein ACYDEY_07925 [Acidimicrobiales bacterium]
MRRIRRNSKVSIVVVGVILAMFGTMAWSTLFGTNDLISPTANLYATAAETPLLIDAQILTGGPTASSYRGVTMNALAADMRLHPPFQSFARCPKLHPSEQKTRVGTRLRTHLLTGCTGFRVILTKGTVIHSFAMSPPPAITVTQVVSVDLCADGKACQEIVIATLGASSKCFFERQTVGNRSIARKEHLRIGYEYQVASVPVCKASDAPSTGWTPGYPNPNS